MTDIIKNRTDTSGGKRTTGQTLMTPFGAIKIEIKARGYKSSEGDQKFDPPAENDDLDGAEERTEKA